MTQVNSWNGKDLRDMFAAGSNWLEKSVAEVNAINVFPVPDGDTGTNMLLTLRSVIEEADRAADATVTVMAKAMSHGALLGARGIPASYCRRSFAAWLKVLMGKKHLPGRIGPKPQLRRRKRPGKACPIRSRVPYSQ